MCCFHRDSRSLRTGHYQGSAEIDPEMRAIGLAGTPLAYRLRLDLAKRESERTSLADAGSATSGSRRESHHHSRSFVRPVRRARRIAWDGNEKNDVSYGPNLLDRRGDEQTTVYTRRPRKPRLGHSFARSSPRRSNIHCRSLGATLMRALSKARCTMSAIPSRPLS